MIFEDQSSTVSSPAHTQSSEQKRRSGDPLSDEQKSSRQSKWQEILRMNEMQTRGHFLREYASILGYFYGGLLTISAFWPHIPLGWASGILLVILLLLSFLLPIMKRICQIFVQTWKEAYHKALKQAKERYDLSQDRA